MIPQAVHFLSASCTVSDKDSSVKSAVCASVLCGLSKKFCSLPWIEVSADYIPADAWVRVPMGIPGSTQLDF